MEDLSFLDSFDIDYLKKSKLINLRALLTDYAVMLEGKTGVRALGKYDNILGNVGAYWTSEVVGKKPYYINTRGRTVSGSVNDEHVSCRVVLKNFDLSKMSDCVKLDDDLYRVTFGRYPQMAVSKKLNNALDSLYSLNKLKKTGNYFSRETIKEINDLYNHKITCEIVSQEEYEYRGRYFIRVLTDRNYSFEEHKKNEYLVSNGDVCQFGGYKWVEVLPLKWLAIKSKNLMITERIILSGITYDFNKINDDNSFEKSYLNEYINQYLKYEIIQPVSKKELKKDINSDKQIEENFKKKNYNPYNFDFRKLSEEDILKDAVISDVPVFLHGKSSVGKSARVKQLDPDAEVIYMMNATPEGLLGKMVYDSEKDEVIDVSPVWYKKLKKKCDTEPNKLHILFFDELSNATASLQGMAFNIILDKEVNGIWKLPENVRIVAAGNEVEDSLAANQLSEPLFNRFAHVYIDTKTDDWLLWAFDADKKNEKLDNIKIDLKEKIHPAIITYINLRKFSNKNVLRSTYTGDKPNADPRKWEMASKMLYSTNKPDALRSLVGVPITKDFIGFCQNKTLTVDDVLNNKYHDEDLDMDISQKYATTLSLSLVDDEHIETIRDFMSKIGQEYKTVFDSLWVRDDIKRLEKIKELKIEEKYEKGKTK